MKLRFREWLTSDSPLFLEDSWENLGINLDDTDYAPRPDLGNFDNSSTDPAGSPPPSVENPDHERAREIYLQWTRDNPDTMFRQDESGTFIYHKGEGGEDVLTYDVGKEVSHADLFTREYERYHKLFGMKGMWWDNATNPYDVRKIRLDGEKPALYQNLVLLGRVGKSPHDQRPIVSFWNTDDGVYQKLLAPCLQKLLQDGKVTPQTAVITPRHPASSVEEAIKSGVKAAGPMSQKKVNIGGKDYDLTSLVGMLHTLPQMSPERGQIEDFIRHSPDDGDPVMRELKSRVGNNTPGAAHRQAKRQPWIDATKNPYLFKYGEGRLGPILRKPA